MISKNGVPEFTPAALTKMSTRPKRFSTSSSVCCRAVLLVASQATPIAPRPSVSIDLALASAFSLVLPRIATSDPAWANPVAIAPPRTPPPPITTATLPVNEKSPLLRHA